MNRIPHNRIGHLLDLPLYAAAALTVFGAASSRGADLGVPGATQVEYTFGENGIYGDANFHADASGNGRTMFGGYSVDSWLGGPLVNGSTHSLMIVNGEGAWVMNNSAGMATDFQVSIFLSASPNWPSTGSNNGPETAILHIGDLWLQADGNTGDGSMTYYASLAGTRIGTYTAPQWQATGLMVQKLKNVFSYWVSTDYGTSWSQFGSDITAPSATINFGGTHLFVQPGGGNNYTGYADDFKVVAVPVPAAPRSCAPAASCRWWVARG